jgi:hypothetical protein
MDRFNIFLEDIFENDNSEEIKIVNDFIGKI